MAEPEAMIARPYAAARRTLSIGEKLLEVNWGLVMLITMIACVGFAMLYSVAGGHFEPWASAQIMRFIVGLVVLIAVACIDIRIWMDLAYPAYALSLLLLVATTIAGHVGGLGAQRWIELGPLAAPAFRTDEDLAGSCARALSARAQRRGGVRAAQALHSACDDRRAGRARADAAQSRHGHDPGRRRRLAAVPRRAQLVVDRARPRPASWPRCRSPGSFCTTTRSSAS